MYSYLYDELHTSPGAQGSHEVAFLPQTGKVDHDASYDGNGSKPEET
jgi:hypothetical protein